MFAERTSTLCYVRGANIDTLREINQLLNPFARAPSAATAPAKFAKNGEKTHVEHLFFARSSQSLPPGGPID
jgi:hypothetical protein